MLKNCSIEEINVIEFTVEQIVNKIDKKHKIKKVKVEIFINNSFYFDPLILQ